MPSPIAKQTGFIEQADRTGRLEGRLLSDGHEAVQAAANTHIQAKPGGMRLSPANVVISVAILRTDSFTSHGEMIRSGAEDGR